MLESDSQCIPPVTTIRQSDQIERLFEKRGINSSHQMFVGKEGGFQLTSNACGKREALTAHFERLWEKRRLNSSHRTLVGKEKG